MIRKDEIRKRKLVVVLGPTVRRIRSIKSKGGRGSYPSGRGTREAKQGPRSGTGPASGRQCGEAAQRRQWQQRGEETSQEESRSGSGTAVGPEPALLLVLLVVLLY